MNRINLLYRFTTRFCNGRELPFFPIRRNTTNAYDVLTKFEERAPRSSYTSPIEQLQKSQETLGKFVTYPKEEFTQFISSFLKSEFLEQLGVFNDYSLLLRQPFFDILRDILKLREIQEYCEENEKSNIGLPDLVKTTVPKFLVYGQPGSGISVTLAQLTHYAGTNDWLIFPFFKAEKWLNRCHDLTHSNDYHQEQHKPHISGDAFDFPNRSADWLRQFIDMNKGFLERHKPLTTRDVAWTKVDIAPSGTPWTELIQFALSRTKYSTDCIGILLREMRTLCSEPSGPPCLLIVDGVNFLWCRGTLLKDKILQIKVSVDRLAIVHHLKRALQADWRHGAIVTSLNVRGAWPTDREKYTPGYLLGKDGLDFMDPFVPVRVENYTAAEFDACMKFYSEHHWLTNPAAYTPEGRAELAFLSDRNPLELDKVVAEW